MSGDTKHSTTIEKGGQILKESGKKRAKTKKESNEAKRKCTESPKRSVRHAKLKELDNFRPLRKKSSLQNRTDGAPRRTDYRTVGHDRGDPGHYYPDGGWGWVVLAVVILSHFLCLGLHLAGSVMLTEVMTRFKTRQTNTVWLCSASHGISLLIRPIVTSACRRRSPRLFAFIGALIVCLGCLFMSFSTELHQMYICYVIVMGTGTGVVLATANIMIDRYFRRRRELVEMLVNTGNGLGMATMAYTIKEILRVYHWMRGMQIFVGIMAPLIIGSILYRSASVYRPRRKVMVHMKTQIYHSLRRHTLEEKESCIDILPLRMRSVQALMGVAGIGAFGLYVPGYLLVQKLSADYDQAVLLLVKLGAGFTAGTLFYGALVMKNSVRCFVARQHLCQICLFGAGVSSSLCSLPDGYRGHDIFSVIYGIMFGGYHYVLKLYVYETVTAKLMERCDAYVTAAQTIGVVIGTPIAVYMNHAIQSQVGGFILAGVAMMIGSLLFFFMPAACNSKTNYKVIQTVHFQQESARVLYGMNVSDWERGNPHDASSVENEIKNHDKGDGEEAEENIVEAKDIDMKSAESSVLDEETRNCYFQRKTKCLKCPHCHKSYDRIEHAESTSDLVHKMRSGDCSSENNNSIQVAEVVCHVSDSADSQCDSNAQTTPSASKDFKIPTIEITTAL